MILIINSNLIFSISKDNNKNSNDSTPPTIKVITPLKSENYIVSKPTIKARIYDENGIKTSGIKIYVNNIDVTSKAKIRDNIVSYTPSKKFKRGSQIVKIVASDKFKNKSSLEWYFIVGTPIYENFSGSFFDINSNININTYNNIFSKCNKYNDFCITSTNLNNSKEDLDILIHSTSKYFKEDEFIPINSFKFNMPSFSDQINLYNVKNLSSYKKYDFENLNALYKNLFLKDNLICQFSPKTKSLSSFDYMKYSYYGDEIFSLIDVSDENQKNIFYLDIYNEALDNGWHIAPISSKFNTKILSTDLNQDSLYNSLKNRRTYVTNNKNIHLEFSINNHPMGSIIKNASKLNFSICVIDTNKSNRIKDICIISNDNKIIKKADFNSNLAKLDFSLDKFDKSSYYYLIITQDNNKITVSAPIWIKNS